MKLLFKQRSLSWFDSYDIYDEAGNTVYSIEGQLSWGHRLHILDAYGSHIGTVKQVVWTFLPKFELYIHDQLVGTIYKEFSFFKPTFHIDYNGWKVEGEIFEWNYQITDGSGATVADIDKQPYKLTDTYVIDVNDSSDALACLMVTLAIDAEKCSRHS